MENDKNKSGHDCSGCIWAFRRENSLFGSSIRCNAPVQERVTLFPDRDQSDVTHFQIEFEAGDTKCKMVGNERGISAADCDIAKSVAERGEGFLNMAVGILNMPPKEAKRKYKWAKLVKKKIFTVKGVVLEPDKKKSKRKKDTK